MNEEILLGARTSVSPDEIIHLEASKNYTTIYFKDGSSLLSSTNLGTLEERLQPYDFFRVNRSTLINLLYLNRFKVHLHKAKGRGSSRKNTHEIVISRRRVAAFQACVNA